MLLAQQLVVNAGKYLTRPAYRYLGKEATYKDFTVAVARLSYLYQHEIGQDNRVAFFVSNAPAVITTFFALTNIRTTIIPLDPTRAPDELEAWLRETKATHLAVTSDLLAKARDLLQGAHLTLPIIEIEKKQGGEYDTSFTPPPENKPLPTDVILILRTSGSGTGKPKYVTFTHKQLLHEAVAFRSQYHLLGTDRFVGTLPWSNPFAFVHHLLFPIMNGACVVIDHGLQALEFLDFLVESRVTRIIGTPPFFLRLLVTCKNEKRLLPGTKSVTVGLGMLEPGLMRAFQLLKVPVAHVYGMTENLWTIAMQDTQEPGGMDDEGGGYRRGFMGKGLSGLKYKVVDDGGDTIETKEARTGQLCVSGPTIMGNYLDKEKETKNALRGTWLYTGDLCTLEGDGEDLRITYVGRKEDILLVNGQRILLTPLDAIIKTTPGVLDGAAFAIKNTKGQPVVACAVIKKAGAAVNEKSVLEFLATKAGGAATPQVVAFTDVIPRDAGGNVLHSKLRGQFSGIAG